MFQKDIYWMKIALKYAYYAKKRGEIPIGAILILKNDIIGIGWNQSIQNHDPTAHAEIIAIRKAGRKIKNYRLLNTTLYVTLEPCAMCLGAIMHSRVKRLVFGAHNSKLNYTKYFKDFLLNFHKNAALEIKTNVLTTKCSRLLIDFFKSKR